jgi:hypothetical protein
LLVKLASAIGLFFYSGARDSMMQKIPLRDLCTSQVCKQISTRFAAEEAVKQHFEGNSSVSSAEPETKVIKMHAAITL